MNAMKFFNNDEGVSPIVATLVLIVVAIIGAAAVGLIMGSFSSNVSQQASAGDASGSASTVINIAGSTSMQPVITILAAQYNANTTGVKVNVAGGGSGVGYMSVEKNMADIGMISEGIVSTQLANYPNLHAYQVGASGVVFVAGSNTLTSVTKGDLVAVYGATSFPVTIEGVSITKAVDRSDVSGTQDTAVAYLGITPSAAVTAVSGNGNVKTAVNGNAGVIGILDSDYAFGATKGLQSSGATGLTILNIDSYTSSWSNIQSQIKNNDGKYPSNLVRPLNLITLGSAPSIDQGFIQYCQNPAAYIQDTFAAAYQVHVSQVNSAYLV